MSCSVILLHQSMAKGGGLLKKQLRGFGGLPYVSVDEK